jgi:cytochrome c oxidase cbb3-type subunit 4
METYERMRHFADSWGLVAITVIFFIAVVWVLRPGAKKSARDAANIPLRDDDNATDGRG